MKIFSLIAGVALAASVVPSTMAVPIGAWPGPVFPPLPVIPIFPIGPSVGIVDVNLLLGGIFIEDETLKRMLGDLLPVYEPTEHKRQKPVEAFNRKGIPPWMITPAMNSLEVPWDNVD